MRLNGGVVASALLEALDLCHTPEPLHDHRHFCTAPLAQREAATRTLTTRPFRWCARACSPHAGGARVDNDQRSTSRNENKINKKQKNTTKDGRGKSASTGRRSGRPRVHLRRRSQATRGQGVSGTSI